MSTRAGRQLEKQRWEAELRFDSFLMERRRSLQQESHPKIPADLLDEAPPPRGRAAEHQWSPIL